VTLASDIGRRSRLLLALTILVGIMHHTDHVLRADHSGWPFIPSVSPFTYSLLAYPILLLALFADRLALGARATGVSILASFTLFAHVAIETPQMQYASWAFNRSIDPALGPIPNLLCTQSPELGWAAMTVSMTLNLLLLAAALSINADWAGKRKTLAAS
jgi:hypothetical protein